MSGGAVFLYKRKGDINSMARNLEDIHGGCETVQHWPETA